MKAKFTERISITLDPETLRKLEACSEEFNESISAIIRECVSQDIRKLVDRKRKAAKRDKARQSLI